MDDLITYEVIAHIKEPYDYVQLVLTICTVLIALFSIIFAGLSYHTQKTFYKKSVIPMVDIHIIDCSDKLSIELVNDGIGPAIIKKIQVTDSRCSIDSFDEFLAQRDKSKIIISESSDLKREYVIGPGKGLTMVSVDKKKYPNSLDYEFAVNTIKDVLRKSRFSISYTDVYGEQKQLDKDMSFFKG